MPSINITFGSVIQSILTVASITFNVLWIALYVFVSWKGHQQPSQQQRGPSVHSNNGGGEIKPTNELLMMMNNNKEPLDINHRKLQEVNNVKEEREQLLEDEDDDDMDKPYSVGPLQRTEENPFRMPLKYVNAAVDDDDHVVGFSHGHCIGNNFREKNSWYFTSCHVHLMCYDPVEQDYVIMENPMEQELKRAISQQTKNKTSQPLFTKDMYTSATDLDVEWSIGVINPQWAAEDWPRLKRSFRRVPPQSYHALPDNVVLAPFHSFAGFNPGHLIWDDFMALWLILDVFDLWKKDKHMLYMRESNPPGEGIWATCDHTEYSHKRCEKLMPKFFPLMGQDLTFLFEKPTQEDIFGEDDDKTNNSNKERRLICAKEGVVGLGMLSDHGMKQHGWWNADYEWNHNVGRGPQLWRFRNFMMENLLGKQGAKAVSRRRRRERPLLIFSEMSSDRPFDIAQFSKFVIQTFGNEVVEVQSVVFHELSTEEQVRLTAEASMLFSIAGGGTVTGMFLPRGASLVLWYESDAQDGGGLVPEPNNIPKTACRLDFDVWNNAGYIRTHWLPYYGEHHQPSVPPGPIFEALIRQELDIMSKQGY